MNLQVRSIGPDELEDWVTCLATAFHNGRPIAEQVAFRRETWDPSFYRTLAALDRPKIVGTLESYATELTLPGGTCVMADAITAVSVLPTHRRRGALTQMITHDLRAARDRGEVAAILMASEYPIYGRFGFGPATTRVEYTVDTAAARFKQPAAGQIEFVEPSRMRELAPPIFDRFRHSRPGQIDREPIRWDIRLGLRQSPWSPRDSVVRCAVHTSPDRELDGYLFYRTEDNWKQRRPGSRIELADLIALSRDAYIGLWRFCCEMDLVNEVRAGLRPPDEPLLWLLDNPRVAVQETRRTDLLWVRPIDVSRFLGTRRYAIEGHLVLEIADPLDLCGGRFALEGGPDGATCAPTTNEPDLRMDMSALGAMSLGGQNLLVLAEAGLIEERSAGAVEVADRMFHSSVTPWCSTFF